ncbi:hypothetical protein ACQUY5_25905, partial [Bacillus cereus]|uniref:hypothetical protein n=1 Tax=Bacillus cereus TaxID=1396 RepID=UPI003D16915E
MVVEYKGNPYKSIHALSEEVGIPYSTINSRLARGFTLEQAIELGSREDIIVFGNEFKTVKELTDFYGIEYHRYLLKLSQGLTHENIVKHLLTKGVINFEGKPYKSLTDLSNQYDISSTLVQQRIVKGKSLKDAVTEPMKSSNKGKGYKFRGVDYLSLRDMTKTYGLQENFVRNYAKKMKISNVQVMEILLTFLSNYSGSRPDLVSSIPSVIYNDIWYSSFTDFFKEVGTDSPTVKVFMSRYRLKNHFQALHQMQQHTVTRWVDNQTGEITSITILKKKYKTNTVAEHGFGRKEVFRTYPKINFNPTGYCALPSLDFKVYMDNLNR